MNEVSEVIVDELYDDKPASRFKQEWEAKKLLKQAKKKSKKQLMTQGHTAKDASHMVKQALRKIVADNKPQTRAAGRGG